MFRRSTKITSLIVAAVSVATMVPAMAADVKKAEDYDGKVYNATAYKDGKFYIDGELEDMDEAAYYNNGGKYNDLEDVDSGDSAKVYGDKYLEVEEGDYYLDLSSGKVTDDEVRKDAFDDASSALRKKVNKDGPSRYANTDVLPDYNEDKYVLDSSDLKVKADKDVSDLVAIPKNKFGEEWYMAKYNRGKDYGSNKIDGDKKPFAVYTDKDGKYIDADYNLGKISFTTTAGSATLKNTDDDDAGCKVAVRHIKTIGSDKDSIYRLAAIVVTNKDTGKNITDTVKFRNDVKGSDVTTEEAAGFKLDGGGKFALAIQKISKEQDSGDIDDAKYAKTVNTYFVTGDDGSKKDDKFLAAYDDNTKFTVSNGKVIAYKLKENKNDGNVKAYAYTLKSKNGYYYTDASDGDDNDAETREADLDDSLTKISVDTDVDGNLYALDGGYVYKFNNDDGWDKVVKVDGSCTDMTVYDKDNIIVWNEDDEVYSIIAGKAKSDDTTTDNNTTTASAGWVQDSASGAWSYVKADGTKAIGWFQSPTSGVWYYMDANGVMKANGWVQDGGSWYFLDSTGAMKTGWVYTGGAWYFLKNTAGNIGAMQTGWIQTGGKWYYCNASGAMLSNTTVGGYRLGADGAWIK